MDVADIRSLKVAVEKDISVLIKGYESSSELKVDKIVIVRQGEYDSLGNEIGFSYAVEVKSYI